MTGRDLLANFYKRCDRRSFLRGCGVLGLGAIAGGTLQSLFDVVRIDRGRLRISRTRLRMGTYVTMTAVHDSRDQAEDAIGHAFAEMDRLIGIFNRHDSSTPISLLNAEGTLRNPPPELVELVRRSLDFTRLSHGTFDITVKPIVDLFAGSGASRGQLPSAAEIEAALDRVGVEKIELREKRLRLCEEGMGVTLDGIAKGYIVDRASDVLASRGIHNHLINAGGDIRVRGTRAGDEPWRIAVQDPEKRANYPDVIQLTNGAVATSGNYEVFFDKERVSHHIIDPRSGRSPAQCESVSAIAGSVMQADALSTAVFVLEPVAGVRLIDTRADSECLVLDQRGREFRSRGWNRFAAT